MQFRIALRCLDPKPVLPINYQYELSAWIYRVIENADADYATFLHQQGYQTPRRKSFKLFCFSQLDVPRREIRGDRLQILSPEISFVIGFYLDRAAEDFVRGLFSEQTLRLGDRFSQARFAVQTVEVRHPASPSPGTAARLRTLSPMVVARKKENGYDDYLPPNDPTFPGLFFQNLLDKFAAATGTPPPDWWDASRFGFRLLTESPRSQLILMKSGTSGETKVRGFRFHFELDVPRELLEVGLLAGFGKHNAEGFGCAEIIENQ